MAINTSTTTDKQTAAVAALNPPPQGRVSVTFRSLKHRNFRLFFGGQMISLVGTWMQTVAEAWLIYRLTGSSVLLGLLGFVGQVPIFLLSPVAGVVADRWPRRRVIITTQSVSMTLALTLATLTLGGRIRVWEIICLATLLGVVNAFDVPARQSFLIEMVGREDLLNAIALNSSMFNGARVAGPAVAGLLVAWIGEGWCFLLNGASYIAVLAGLFMMHIQKSMLPHDTGSPLEKFREGFRFVRRTVPIRTLLLLLGLVSFTALPFSVLMPIFADKILHGGASAYGTLMGAVGGGAMFGALVLAMRRELQGLGKIVSSSAMGLGAALMLFGISRFYWLSLIALALAGFAMMMQFTSTNTLIQAMVPDKLRGRVMALYAMAFLGMSPLGSLIAGTLAARIGAPITVAMGGAASLCGGFLFSRAWPAMRAPARELVAAQGMARSVPSGDLLLPPTQRRTPINYR